MRKTSSCSVMQKHNFKIYSLAYLLMQVMKIINSGKWLRRSYIKKLKTPFGLFDHIIFIEYKFNFIFLKASSLSQQGNMPVRNGKYIRMREGFLFFGRDISSQKSNT